MHVVIRVDQVGFGPGQEKSAFVLTQRVVGSPRFTVVGADGRVALGSGRSARCPGLNRRWRGCRIVDFSSLRRLGVYRVRVSGALSPPFRIEPEPRLFDRLALHALGFLQAQRDGDGVIPELLHRHPAHLNDARAEIYRSPRYGAGGALLSAPRGTAMHVNAVGGWFDSGDYLKFTGSASFTDVLLLFTLRQYGGRLGFPGALAREARYGTDWLLKMWDPRRGVLLEQVGLGDGSSGGILGDHDLWRLPQADDRFRGRDSRFLAHRPVFAANDAGKPISPNLAGRTTAAFALAAQVFAKSDRAYALRCLAAANSLYDAAAKSWRGRLAFSAPVTYYSETTWRDDMELAATELYIAGAQLGLPALSHRPRYYLEAASSWADSYLSSASAGQDALNLYDVAPLAHYDLYRLMVATGHTTDLYTNAVDLTNDLHDELRLAEKLTRTGPFGLADPATPQDTVAHALGYAAEARLYGELTRTGAYEGLAGRQLGWVLGANPWGTSFVVGAGSLFPRCLAHQVANLSGSLNGRGRLLLGAVVPGPTGSGGIYPLGAPDGFRKCGSAGSGLAAFNGHGFGYLDDVRSYTTSEPSDDLMALSLLAFAQRVSGGRSAALKLSVS